MADTIYLACTWYLISLVTGLCNKGATNEIRDMYTYHSWTCGSLPLLRLPRKYSAQCIDGKVSFETARARAQPVARLSTGVLSRATSICG